MRSTKKAIRLLQRQIAESQTSITEYVDMIGECSKNDNAAERCWQIETYLCCILDDQRSIREYVDQLVNLANEKYNQPKLYDKPFSSLCLSRKATDEWNKIYIWQATKKLRFSAVRLETIGDIMKYAIERVHYISTSKIKIINSPTIRNECLTTFIELCAKLKKIGCKHDTIEMILQTHPFFGIGLQPRTCHALFNSEIRNLKSLIAAYGGKRDNLKKIPRIGDKAADEIVEALKSHNLI